MAIKLKYPILQNNLPDLEQFIKEIAKFVKEHTT